MQPRRRFLGLGRSAFCAVLVGVSCANVLDLEEPHERPNDTGGTGGSAGTGGDTPGGDGGGNAAGQGGAAGSSGAEGGSAGHAGMDATGGDGQSGTAGGGGAGEAGGGQGGAPPSCDDGERRCGGDESLTPEICEDGRWTPNEDENQGNDCPILCAEGRCTECETGHSRCSERTRQDCVDGTWQSEELCEDYCSRGECVNAPSCAGGLACAGSTSCCRALEVTGHEPFKRDFDGTEDYSNGSYTADVRSFVLDKFDVTVGRLRNFVDAYDNIERSQGDGRSTYVDGDTGWHDDYTMPASKADLVTMLEDSSACPDTTWTSGGIRTNETLPANCVTFPIAYAFCLWDLGRLPTEAEWNYAAAGGGDQRWYPWQAPLEDEPPSAQYAFYDQPGGLPLAVGSKSDGDGRWGHSDLAGNVLQWTLDFKGDEYPTTCVDCMNPTPAPFRVVRGGSYLGPDFTLRVSFRVWEASTYDRSRDIGFRCVHEIE